VLRRKACLIKKRAEFFIVPTGEGEKMLAAIKMIAETEKSDQFLRALIQIGQELAATTELSELLEKILTISREVFQFENAIIRLFNEKTQTLEAVSAYGYTPEAMQQSIRVGQGVMGKVAATVEPVLIEDVREVPDYVPGISGALSELAVPLVCRDRLIGVFNVESPNAGAFTKRDIAPLMTMAGQAAVAIENARLYERLRTMSDRYQKLHETNDRILRSVNLGIYTVDADLKIMSWNRRMEEMSGVKAEKAIGSDLAELFPTLVEEGVIERIRGVLASGTSGKLRLLHRNHDGQCQIQKRRLAPLRDGDLVHGVAVIVEDITEFQKLLDQTIHSEKLVEVGRLSAGIAHEINNPLGVIMYAAELLKREQGLTPFQEEMAERIISEVGRLRVLTGGLLSFSQPRKSMTRLVEINPLVEEVLHLVRYELQKQSIQLETDFATLPLISADPNKLKQVVINLIMNAAQALGRGGKISLRTRPCGKDDIELLVSDNGPGIEPEVQEQVFKPFFTTKSDGEGTGLGLYICDNIIKEHGGTILLESAPGRGATFRIRFPAA
jgi:PAS domain S-box-containing protein